MTGQEEKSAEDNTGPPSSKSAQCHDKIKSIFVTALALEFYRYFQERRANQQQQQPAETSARSTARATWVIAFFTFATVAVGIFGYFALRGQQNVMQGQLDEMKQSFAADRAYIFLTGVVRDESKPIEPGYTIIAHFKNFGRTPAIITRLAMTCKWFAIPPPPILPEDAKMSFYPTVGAGEPLGEFQNPVAASAAEIEQARKGIGTIRCIWNVFYSDVRANPHVGGICMFYDFSSRLLMFCREPQYRYVSDQNSVPP